MKLNPRVRKVKAESGYRIRLTFTNGEERIYDIRHLVGQGVFRELKDESVFRSVRQCHGSVKWSGGQDICPDTLYEDSIPVKRIAVCESRVKYAVKRKKNQQRTLRRSCCASD